MLEKRMKPMGRLTSLVVRCNFCKGWQAIAKAYLFIKSTLVPHPGNQEFGISGHYTPDNKIWPNPTDGVCVFSEG